jgi:hypothetical protein
MSKDNEDLLIKELLAHYKGPEDLIGQNGLRKRLTKKLVEGALGAEMTDSPLASRVRNSPELTRSSDPVHSTLHPYNQRLNPLAVLSFYIL